MTTPPQCRGWGRGLLRLFLAVQVTLAGWAAVPLGGQERLQQLTRLPRFSFNFGLSFRGTEGFELMVGTPDPTRELTALREALTGQTDDAPRFVRLGRVLDGLNEMAMAQRAYARAVELYERQGAADSREIAVLVGYADALRGQNQFAAAERLLRRAVEIAPEDWQPRPALARLLGLTAIHALASLEGKPAGIDWAQLLSDPAAVRLNAAGVEEAERRLAEAVQEAERGVKLGPQQADTFLARANVGTARRLASALRALTEAPEDEPAARIWAVNRAIFHRDALPDLWAAARLSPNNPQAWGCAVLLELMAEGLRQGLRGAEALLADNLWSRLPESSRVTVREALARLESMSEGREPAAAAAALTLLGWFQGFLLNDPTRGEATLRRALVLDAGHSSAWETLTALLVVARRMDALVEVCQARLERADTPHHRLMLVKAYEKAQQVPAMRREAEETQARYPEHFLANLTLAAALLKTGEEAARARAVQYLAKATQLAGESPPRDAALELWFQRGLYFGLSGQRAVARTHFRQLLEAGADPEEVREALQALDQMGE